MFRGGYKIIDLGDANITDEGVTVAGTYAAIEHSNRKALCLCNVTISGVEKNDAFVSVAVDDSAYIIETYGVKISVDADDLVKIVTE